MGASHAETAAGQERDDQQSRARRRDGGDFPDVGVTVAVTHVVQAAVVEQERSYGCSGWRAGCKFAIWKTIAEKKIGVRTAQSLLRKGRSPLLKGFTSKAGKRFDARNCG